MLTMGGMYLTNWSLRYLNYVTRIVFKSSKVVPTMMIGTLVQVRRLDSSCHRILHCACYEVAAPHGWVRDKSTSFELARQGAPGGLADKPFRGNPVSDTRLDKSRFFCTPVLYASITCKG